MGRPRPGPFVPADTLEIGLESDPTASAARRTLAMVCPGCRREVPDESVFCLACGARLAPPGGASPAGGGTVPPPEAPADTAAVAEVAIGVKAVYALSARRIADDRLRYRVARWAVGWAPAHEIGEVQEALRQGDFTTLLAMTPEDAERARREVAALGAQGIRLAPSRAADALPLPTRPVRPPAGAGGSKQWTPRQRWLAVGLGLGILFVFGMVARLAFG